MVKRVILCFNKDEQEEVNAYISRMRLVEEEKGRDSDELDIRVIYPCDISAAQYLTWTGTNPTSKDKKILNSLTAEDKIIIWGHGAPNYSTMPGAVYTEVADYLEKTINKDNFGPGKGPLKIAVETCNGARGGEQGENSFAANLHALLGKKGIHTTVSARLLYVMVDIKTLAQEGIKTLDPFVWSLGEVGIYHSEGERKAAQSKVTYIWNNEDPKEQVRVDSYRRKAYSNFLSLKQNILDKVNSSSSTLMNPGQLHRLLLTIELNLHHGEGTINLSIINKTTEELSEYCQFLGISFEELQQPQFGLTRFLESVNRKAVKDGFISIKTGLKQNDPLLEIEQRPIIDTINNHPRFVELNRIVTGLSKQNSEIAKRLVEVIGTKKNCDIDNFYSNVFLLFRRHNLVNNDGKMEIPDYVDKTLEQINHLLSLTFESELEPAQKASQLAELKKELVNFKNANYEFKLMSSLHGNEPTKEGIMYFENSNPGFLKYKILVGEQVQYGEINIMSLPNLSAKERTKLQECSMGALNSAKDQILDITSSRGHTEKQLTFWGLFCVMLAAVEKSYKSVWAERHEASAIEFIGGFFTKPYYVIKEEVEQYTYDATQIHKIVQGCEEEIAVQLQAAKPADKESNARIAGYDNYGLFRPTPAPLDDDHIEPLTPTTPNKGS